MKINLPKGCNGYFFRCHSFAFNLYGLSYDTANYAAQDLVEQNIIKPLAETKIKRGDIVLYRCKDSNAWEEYDEFYHYGIVTDSIKKLVISKIGAGAVKKHSIYDDVYDEFKFSVYILPREHIRTFLKLCFDYGDWWDKPKYTQQNKINKLVVVA